MILSVLAESPEVGGKTITALQRLGFLAPKTPSITQTAPAVPDDDPMSDGGASIAAALRQLELLSTWPETTRKPTRGEVEELVWS